MSDLEEASRLGELLVMTLAVTEDAVERAVEAQREGDTRNIGEILCEDAELESEDLATAVELQRRMRGGDFFAAVVDGVQLAYERARRSMAPGQPETAKHD